MRKNRWFIAVMILVIIAVGTGGFFIGKHVEKQHDQESREFDILLNRSELEWLGKTDETIYVTGHKSPDSDTVVSAIVYASLLQSLGYHTVPVVLGSLKNETKYILNAAGVEAPELLADASGQNMILVDHSDYTQSADGLQDARIISIIDHHGDGSVTTGNPIIYDARPMGATTTIIWMRYRHYGIEPTRQNALIMAGAILSDTSNLKSDTTTTADREALKALSKLAGISDVNAFYQEIFKASISYEGFTDEEIFFSDYKEYESDGTKYAIGCINAYDEAGAEDLIKRMSQIVPSMLTTTGMNMAFAQISIFHDDISITYLVPSDEAAGEVLESAFGETAVFDGAAYRLEPGFSRKKLVSAITDVLKSHPKE